MEPTVIFDGIFFQLNNTGIARVWMSLFDVWSRRGQFEGAVILDRGRKSPRFDGFRYVDFPNYDFVNTSEDSRRVEKICQRYRADVFASSYYTTPISTPTMMMVYDMIPERFDFGMDERGWREKSLAIRHASAFVAISQSTAVDLLQFYPEIPEESVAVAHCSVDRKVFQERPEVEIQAARAKFGIGGAFYLFVGDRSQLKGYKNSKLFFDALGKIKDDCDFSVVCVGGKTELEDYIAAETNRIDIHLINPSDEELSALYSDAIALVYPSLYEGFGLPIIEAMACGCPVITTREGSIPEAAGDAAYAIGGYDVDEMLEAIHKVRDPSVRNELILKGLHNIDRFSWERMADRTGHAIRSVAATGRKMRDQTLLHAWAQYRRISADLQ